VEGERNKEIACKRTRGTDLQTPDDEEIQGGPTSRGEAASRTVPGGKKDMRFKPNTTAIGKPVTDAQREQPLHKKQGNSTQQKAWEPDFFVVNGLRRQKSSTVKCAGSAGAKHGGRGGSIKRVTDHIGEESG